MTDLIRDLILNDIKEKDPEIYSNIDFVRKVSEIDSVTTDRYSTIFLFDLFFGYQNNDININAIMHEVKILEGGEGVSRAKLATQFRRLPLKNLWHKHYYDGSITAIAHNVLNAMNSYGSPYFESLIEKSNQSNRVEYVTPEHIPHIVNDVVTLNLGRRQSENKTTGEWIVYAVHEGVNYYLCLAKHSDKDEDIRKKIDPMCIKEFPFLNDILE